MNKEYFINEMKKKLDYNDQEIEIINKILEETFIIGRNNKEKIINKLIERLNVNEKEANHIYETTSSIIASSLAERLKHPFKSIEE